MATDRLSEYVILIFFLPTAMLRRKRLNVVSLTVQACTLLLRSLSCQLCKTTSLGVGRPSRGYNRKQQKRDRTVWYIVITQSGIRLRRMAMNEYVKKNQRVKCSVVFFFPVIIIIIITYSTEQRPS
jgi:hypothetical protein